MICPDFLRDAALKLGCPSGDVDALWETHVELCDKDRSDYGGRRWTGLVAKHVGDAKTDAPTIKRDDPEVVRMRAREAEARIVEEQEYRKTAVTLEDWLADLRVKPDFGEVRTPVEEQLTRFRDRQPGERPEAWLLDALRSRPR